MSQVGSGEQHKEHENELFPRFIANLDTAAVNEISIRFLTRPLFRCLFFPSMSASVLLKVANGPQGLGRHYASLRMRKRTRKRRLRTRRIIKIRWRRFRKYTGGK